MGERWARDGREMGERDSEDAVKLELICVATWLVLWRGQADVERAVTRHAPSLLL